MTKKDEHKDIKKLQESLEVAEKKAEEALQGWQRAKADYLNFKRDQEKRAEEMAQYANAAVIAELLPVINNYKLAWQHVPDESRDQEWMKGFSYIQKQLQDFLQKFGISEIKTVGEKFNPEFHEALTHEEHEGTESDYVFEEVQPGYMLHGKVIEPAKVKVAK